MSRSPRLVRHAVLVTAAALTLTSLPSAAGAAPPGADPVPAQPSAPGRYIVSLAQAPIASYDGGVRGLDATRPADGRRVEVRTRAAQEYRGYLTRQQDAVAARVGAEVRQHYSVSLNGFVADLTPAQAQRLSRTSGVIAVSKDTVRHATDDKNSVDYLKLSGSKGLWSSLGGTGKSGAGVVVGVIDTGIWPESASFAGAALGTAGPSKSDPYRPYRTGSTITMAKSDGSTFTGVCQTGEAFDASDCNTKVVGARYFREGLDAAVAADPTLDYTSPRDGGGHGSHTASTAAGNTGVAASVGGRDFGKISGVAPAARIAAYKALWTFDAENEGVGFTSDLVQAIDAAVGDGVDVINYSIGSDIESPADDPIALAFLGAASAGIFVSASAGNSGPGASTLDNTSPWVTTVGATTIKPYEGTVVLGDGRQFAGVSTTVATTVPSAPLVTAAAVKATAATAEDANRCAAGTLDQALAAGKIVVCDRGVVDRVAKSAEVARAGGVGMVLVNLTTNSLDADLHTVPTVHLDPPAATTVRSYAGTPGATASLRPGNLTSTTTPYPQVAGFSSRGPSLTNNQNLLKPDLVAPGVGILAAVAPPSNQGRDFDFYSGTSMAAPHVAGLAALFLGTGVHPTWSPMRIKSSLMTTAHDTRTATGKVATDPTAQGAGEVTPTKMFNPGLVYRAFENDWTRYLESVGVDTGTALSPRSTSDYNDPSIAIGTLLGRQTVTRTVTAVRTGTYKASVSVPGMKATVSPSTLTFKKYGESKSFKVTLTRSSAPYDRAATGFLTWRGPSSTSVRSPIAVTPRLVTAPAVVAASSLDGALRYWITPGVDGRFPVRASGLTSGREQEDTVAEKGEKSYPVTLAADTKVAQFSVRTEASGADVDLEVYQLGGDEPVLVGASGSPSGNETVTLPDPERGDYLVKVVGFADAPGTTSTAYTFRSAAVTASSDGGDFTVTPDNPTAEAAQPIRLRASWSGLDPTTPYVGYVEYPDGSGTVVTLN